MKHTKAFYFYIIMIVVSVLLIFGAAIMTGFYNSFPATFDPLALILVMFFMGLAGVITFSALTTIAAENRRWR